MQGKVCAIHQPNFFPWLGFFDKIKRCDKFVLLDNVQIPKTGGGWTNRVSINVQGESRWLTAPINRPSGVWNINETTFQNTNWRDKTIKTLYANYSRAPFFKNNKDFIFELVNFSSDNLAEYNFNAIRQLCILMDINIENKFVLASSLSLKTASNQLLIDITKAVGCSTYMAGGGADGYQNINMFADQDINFVYQRFAHPEYTQGKTTNFLNGLSIIDFIFNSGRFS